MHKPKILLYDLETEPNVSYTWGKYEQDVIAFEKEGGLLSFSAKWLEGPQTTKGLCDYDCADDRELVGELYGLISEADIVIAHNGDRFDIRKMNTRFIYHGFTPPNPYRTVDTLKVARRHFAFNSNKLDDLGNFLKVGRKVKHQGFELWLGCMRGDERSWQLMKRYNRQDVLLLEQVYLKLLPWIQHHPAIAYDGDCTNCGGEVFATTRTYMTKKGEKTRYQCSRCGHWS